ncbi:hypothetical protein [Agromyces kandeliae]|uniref:hypothetical protein n=1 Tax=Agromyces kandeliae TaxID=2666141 RepID=UPI0018A1F8A5|nr:hypothetical protein [Agromyces kandeliae]
MIYEDRDRLKRALQASAEGTSRQLELDEAARECAEALMTGAIDLAQVHAQRYSDLKGMPAAAPAGA